MGKRRARRAPADDPRWWIWLAGYVDGNASLRSYRRRDGRRVLRLRLSGRGSVQHLIDIQDALHCGSLSLDEHYRWVLVVEGVNVVPQVLRRLLPHLIVLRAQAEQIIEDFHPEPRVCAIPGCHRLAAARDVCSLHYARARRRGLPPRNAAAHCLLCGRTRPGAASQDTGWTGASEGSLTVCPECNTALADPRPPTRRAGS